MIGVQADQPGIIDTQELHRDAGARQNDIRKPKDCPLYPVEPRHGHG